MVDFNLKFFYKNIINFIVLQLPLLNFYKRNELLWLDTYFLDYLQKKTVDLWIRRFIIFTGFILSEHYIFNKIIRFYTLNIHNVLNYLTIFENSNVIENFLNIIFFFVTLILILFFVQLIFI
uniref:Uncharacterized protein n=1 Tax=Strombidium sp. TaxID=181122 RepID=A0A7T0M4J1_9SPIT|nr:hypothetical protein [Strombidium sp.]